MAGIGLIFVEKFRFCKLKKKKPSLLTEIIVNAMMALKDVWDYNKKKKIRKGDH